jgi:sterol desaturase/sphingolipid hydroxylase (fatty acid hydroxylase superfamily)
MIETALEHEPMLRFGAFLAVFATLAGWEALAPHRPAGYRRIQRWPHNLGLLTVDVLVTRLIVPGAAIAVAIAGEVHGWGVLNMFALPMWLAVLLTVVLLDLALYFQHVVFHAIPLLWRLHRVHHADPHMDVTTGTRFHPLEVLISVVIKCIAVAAIGPPAIAVLVFEVLLSGTALFNHANGWLPQRLDRWLRWIVVTPDMHRVHHSIVEYECNTNFGFNLPWWDRLFGTYRDQPTARHVGMKIGVDGFSGSEQLRIDRLLVQPFARRPANPISLPLQSVEAIAAPFDSGAGKASSG